MGFLWSGLFENQKIKICKALINYFLGSYLDLSLQDDQLSYVDGKFICKEISLNTNEINSLLHQNGIPIEVNIAFIERITVCPPWNTSTDAPSLEFQGLELEIHPRLRSKTMCTDNVFDSMISSMTRGDVSMERSVMASLEVPTANQGTPAFDEMAKYIDKLVSNISVTLNNTLIRFEHTSEDRDKGIGFNVRIKRMNMRRGDLPSDELDDRGGPGYSESRGGSSKYQDSTDGASSTTGSFFDGASASYRPSTSASSSKPPPSDVGGAPFGVVCKNLDITDVSVSWDVFTPKSDEENSGDAPGQTEEGAVMLASLPGQQTVRVIARTNSSPKCQFLVSLSPLHVFLTPEELHMMMGLYRDISTEAASETSTLERGPDSLASQEKTSLLVGNWLNKDSEPPPSNSHFPHGGSAECSQVFQSCMSDFPGDNFQDDDSDTVFTDMNLDNNAMSDNRHATVQCELMSLQISVSFVTIVLLQQEPDSGQQLSSASGSSGSSPTLPDYEQLQRLAKRHFGQVRQLQVSLEDFDQMGGSETIFLRGIRDKVAAICTRDHICILSRLIRWKVSIASSNLQKNTIEASIQSMEIVETLYDTPSEAGSLFTSRSSPQYLELAKFKSPPSGESPCMKARIETSTMGKSTSTDVSIALEKCSIEVDISIKDRLTALFDDRISESSYKYRARQPQSFESFTTPPGGLCPKPSSSPQPYIGFAAAASTGDHRVTAIDLTGSLISIRLHFPVADLRPADQRPRGMPWWQRNRQRSLRPEVLDLNLKNVQIDSKLGSEDTVASVQMTATDVNAEFLANNVRYAFLKTNFTSSKQLFKMEVRSQPPGQNIVDITPPPEDSLIGIVDLPKETCDKIPLITGRAFNIDSTLFKNNISENRPKSADRRKKSRNEDQHPHDPDFAFQKEEYRNLDRPTHYPAGAAGMEEYRSNVLDHSQLVVKLTVPNVEIILPDKNTIGLLYQRLCCDLVLWEPATPKDNPKMCDKQGQLLNINAPISAPSMATMNNQDSDDDDDDESTSRSLGGDNQPPVVVAKQSSFCFLLDVRSMKASFQPATQNSGDQRMQNPYDDTITMNFEHTTVFFESAHNGEPDLSYLTVQMRKLRLFRLDNAIIEAAPSGIRHAFNDDLNGEEMLSLAVEFREGTLQNKPAGHSPHDKGSTIVQHITLACRLSEALVHYHIEPASNSWIQHLIALTELPDPDILGYVVPEAVTVTHLHVGKIAVDYRPKTGPHSCLLSCNHLTLTSNVVLKSKSTTLDILLENTRIFLVPQEKHRSLQEDMRRHFVCVADLDHFELSMIFTEVNQQSCTDVLCMNNMLVVQTCADSCAAIVDTVQRLCCEQAQADLKDAELLAANSTTDRLPARSMSMDEEESGPSGFSTQQSFEQPATSKALPKSKEKLKMLIDAIDTSDAYQSLDDPVPPASLSDDDFVLVDEASIPHEKDHMESLLQPGEQLVYEADYFHNAKTKKRGPFEDPERYPRRPLLAITVFDASITWKIFDGNDFPFKKPSADSASSSMTGPRSNSSSAGSSGTLRSRAGSQQVSFENASASSSPKPTQQVRFSKSTSASALSSSMMGGGGKGATSNSRSGVKPGCGDVRGGLESQKRGQWCKRGGEGRQINKSMELQLTKINYRFSRFPETSSFAARHVFSVRQIEIRDQLSTSKMNKFLCLYQHEDIPYDDKAPMLMLKVVSERKNVDLGPDNLESEIKISIQPLRLHVDQDAWEFLVTYSSEVQQIISKSLPQVQPLDNGYAILSMTDEDTSATREGAEGQEIPEKDAASAQGSLSTPIMYIRKFTFAPDLHILIDYTGNGINISKGTLYGLLAGVTSLNNSRIKIRRLRYERGFTGLDRLIKAIVSDWTGDIPTHIRGVLSGFGPMHEVIQIVTGFRDLIVMPVEQYRQDGGIMRGIKGGARSFSASTLVALLELTSKGVRVIQSAAEFAYDLATPNAPLRQRALQLRQPIDFREGINNAGVAMANGFYRVQYDMNQAATRPDKEGLAATMGEVLRQVPPTIVTPIFVITEAFLHILIGLRSEVRPSSIREDERKWKGASDL